MTRIKKYASGGSTDKGKRQPDLTNYKSLGNKALDFYNQGWYMDTDPIKGVSSFKNRIPIYNDVLTDPTKGTKGYLGVTVNKDGKLNLDIKGQDGGIVENVINGGSYDDLNTYLTNNKSLAQQRNNKVLATVPAKATSVNNAGSIIGDDPDILTSSVSTTKLGNGGVAGAVADNLPSILNSVISLIDGNSTDKSSQPLVNPSVARAMVSPYAFGGNVEDDDNEIKTFFNNYLGSPNYKKRLLKQGYTNTNDVVKSRLKNLKTMTIKENPYFETQYHPKWNGITVNNKQFKNDPSLSYSSTVAHEMSHGLGALEDFNTSSPNLKLNNNEVNQFKSRNKLTGINTGYNSELSIDDKLQVLHDKKPSESKADIDALRYRLSKDKIYDTGTQEFNQSTLNKAKKKYSSDVIGRLFTNFSDKDLIYLMNNIAYNKRSNNTYMAAYGGTIDDLSEEEFQQLQQQADAQGISVEDLFNSINNQDYQSQSDGDGSDSEDPLSDLDSDSYASGGTIHIKTKNKGKFNALKKKTGKSTGELTHSKNPLTRKRAIFAQNAAKWKHAYGGKVNAEVEGNEILEPPGKQPFKVHGPKHENGGIPVRVPHGTKVYSDRLKIGGETMQERKAHREQRLNKLNNLLEPNPTNKLLKNTIDRTKQILDGEDENDMYIQQVANSMMRPPTRQTAAYGDILGNDPYDVPFFTEEDLGNDPNASNYSPNITGDNVNTTNQSSGRSNNFSLKLPDELKNLTTGDYIGMAGTIFNSVAPLINTNAAARATKPAINRYSGFGHDALATNDAEQDYSSRDLSNNLSDIDTDYNSSVARNRNSASSVNTVRALDIASDMARDKAKNAARGSFDSREIGILGQRASLQSQRDQYVDYGQTQADLENQANTDNYFTNKAQNLVNFGTGIETIGKDLNISKSNSVNSKLLSQLSQYGLAIDEDGNLINAK